MRLVSYHVTIAAPVELVWAHLTAVAASARFLGPRVNLSGACS
jgi:uncharacterized protein YndB with AHSA1/START domain